MKVSNLKTLALIMWGAVLGIIGLLGMSVFANQDLRSLAAGQPSPVSSPSPVLLPATLTFTPMPAVIYLPSATARAATDMPVTPTMTPGMLMPMLQYAITLAPDADPLTGLRPEQPELLNRRPVAVKISSFPRGLVRPYQTGLTRADLVYEYYIEDGLTRFIAVFYARNAERAGPVRSGRYFDEYIMRMYHSALVYGHADKRVEDYLLASDLRSFLFEEQDSYFPPLWDSGSKNAENRLFVDTAGVGAKLSDNSRQKLRAAMFGALMYPKALPVINKISTHYSIYSYNYWEYDPTNRVYLRFSDAADATSFTQGETYAAHIDNLTGEQLSANNVIVLVVPHIFHNEFDRADQLLDIELKGSGKAFLFRDGRMLQVKWLRDLVDQPIRLEDEDGRDVPLQPGVTYYQVIDPDSSVKQTGEMIEFTFFTQLRKVTPTPTPFGFEPTATPRKSHK